MVIHIPINVIATSTYELIDNEFYCTHDEREIDTYYEYPSYFSAVEVEKQGYFCVSCGEPLDGDPVAEREEYLAEMRAEEQLMEILGK